MPSGWGTASLVTHYQDPESAGEREAARGRSSLAERHFPAAPGRDQQRDRLCLPRAVGAAPPHGP